MFRALPIFVLLSVFLFSSQVLAETPSENAENGCASSTSLPPLPSFIEKELDDSPRSLFELRLGGSKYSVARTKQARMFRADKRRPKDPFGHVELYFELIRREGLQECVEVVVVSYAQLRQVAALYSDVSKDMKKTGQVWNIREGATRVYVSGFDSGEAVLRLEKLLAQLSLFYKAMGGASRTGADTKGQWEAASVSARGLMDKILGNVRMQIAWSPLPFPQKERSAAATDGSSERTVASGAFARKPEN